MKPIELAEAKVSDLEVFANPADVRHDLHAFVEYVRAHEIKRSHRGNQIPPSHQQRLAKVLSDPTIAAQADHWGNSRWIDHLDWLSRTLKFIAYDTEGSYAGYTSSEPSFPDNFIKFKPAEYQRFADWPLAAQEERILEAHMKGPEGCNSEFFSPGTLTRLDRFDSFGCATGVVPLINFAKARRHLLELLAQCPVGTWWSTASLIEHLRQHDRWFLIPKDLPASATKSWKHSGRYINFVERKRNDWGERDPIPDRDPEAFEKVEGRFVERFLEGVPLELGYTEVAYSRRKTETPIVPERGLLPAFRVTEKLARAVRGEIAEPKVTVLPNFEVHVESLFYPAALDQQLRPLGEPVQRGIVTIFKLTKPRVAAALAAHPELNVVSMLENLSGRPLPANLTQELNDWAGHSEKFLLYAGYGLLEGRRETAPGADRFVVEPISPQLALVRSPEKLYRHLEATEQVPLKIQHAEKALAAPPQVRSRLAPSAAPARAPGKKPLTLKRSVQTTLWFTDAEAHAAFSKLLLDAKCVVLTDKRALTVTYPPKAEALVKECLKQLQQQYAVRVEEIEA